MKFWSIPISTNECLGADDTCNVFLLRDQENILVCFVQTIKQILYLELETFFLHLQVMIFLRLQLCLRQCFCWKSSGLEVSPRDRLIPSLQTKNKMTRMQVDMNPKTRRSVSRVQRNNRVSRTPCRKKHTHATIITLSIGTDRPEQTV